MVAISEHSAAFERCPGLPLHAELSSDREFRRACCGLDVAALDDALDIEVVAPLLVHRVAAAVHIARRVDHGIEHLEIDPNGVGEVLDAVRAPARANEILQIRPFQESSGSIHIRGADGIR